jgi:hypothetical protein
VLPRYREEAKSAESAKRRFFAAKNAENAKTDRCSLDRLAGGCRV